MSEIRSKMTVNYNFDLEDDDYFADNFLSSISEKDLLTSTAISKVIEQEPTKNYTETVESQHPKDKKSITLSKHFDIKGNGNKDSNNSKDAFSNQTIESKKECVIVSPLLDSSNDALNVNSRFVPGFTPKARKRKFPGPAGVYTQQNPKLQILSCDTENTCDKTLEEESEVQDVTSSQFTTNDLLLPSWQNLQKDVSSCPNLLSTAKYNSIHTVLNEASKKKLPKHVEVPVLCVLIKKFKSEDSSLVLIDDTGEISGKIYKDVLEEYKEFIKVGSALILKKVTYLCNVLLLKKPSIASIYLEDGTANHVCELTSILENIKPLNQIGCECPGTPNANESVQNSILKLCDASLNSAAKSSTLSLQKYAAGCSKQTVNPKASIPSKQTNFYSTGQQTPTITVSNKKPLNKMSVATKNTSNDFSTKSETSNNNVNSSSNTKVNIPCYTVDKESSAISENLDKLVRMPLPNNSKENEDMFCEDFEMDEFDELLCSLDEKSFVS